MNKPDHNRLPVSKEAARLICLKCPLPDCNEYSLSCPLFGEVNKRRNKSAPPAQRAA